MDTAKLFALICLLCPSNSVGQLIAVEATAKLPRTLAHSAACYDGDDSIFIFGGWEEESAPSYESNKILRYSITTDSVVTMPTTLPVGVMHGSVTMDDLGNFYYAGGYTVNKESRAIFKYSPVDGVITEILTLPQSVTQPGGIFNWNTTTAFFCGGGYVPRSILKFDTAANAINEVAELPLEFDQVAVFWDDIFEFAYIFGSRRNSSDDPTEIMDRPIIVFNPVNGNRIGVIDLTYSAITGPTRTVSDGRYGYALGGFEPYDSIMRFDPISFEVEYLPVANHPGGSEDGLARFWGTSVAYVSKLGRIYFFGGFSTGSSGSVWHDQIWFIETN